MSSVSQQPQNPQATSSNSSASQSTLSYASTAKKAVSSPPIATGSSSTPSPAVAVGGAAPVQTQHGKSNSISPVNGKNSISPAVPAVSAPAIVHSSSAANGGSTNHSRKSSVTISANGPSGMNGGPVGGSKGIQFGSITDSPAATHSTPHVAQPSSAPIAIPNPRVTDPTSSPSPIPQPHPSGGRPPSGLGTQGGNVAFGSFGGDGDRHMRQPSGTQAPLAPGNQQPSHIRRESSQSTDVSNQGSTPGRGGYPQQGGRGRGNYNPQYQQQLGGYPPPTQAFGRGQNSGRGGIPPFQGQGRQMPFPNSPHQAARSPALAPSMPGGPSTPNMNPAIPMQNQQFNGYYPGQHMQQQNFYPQNGQFDPRGMPMQATPMYYPQMQQMGYMQAPQSPQPGYQQPNAYVPGQYAPQPAPMSRNSSQMSEHRPASSMGQPQTPSMAPAVSHPPQSKPTPTPSTTFSRPTRKSAAIVIKRPDGEALDVENLKASQPASPAPSARTRTPPVIASTPTPPPKPSTPLLHTRSDSAAVKTSDQIRLEMIEKVKKAAEGKETSDAQAKADEAAKAAEAKLKEEEKAKADAKAAEEAKAKEEADAKAAADKAKQDEEDELERQIQEMEAAEAEREKKEAEILAKRAVEKAAADKANEEQRKKDAEENDRKLREQEREMERLEDEKEKKRAAAEAAKVSGSDAVSADKKAVKEDDKTAPNTPTTLASKLSNLSITESGATTPTSDDSMGPPPKVNLAEKRSKPANLNLTQLNTKPIEPPQPSAALMSLKSARFLTIMNSSLYPPSINSPNPALNSAVTTKGKSFKYDTGFLLQFQKVFTEKPSVEFESQIKALIGEGDGGSARSASTRGPGGGSMGPRQNSTRNNQPGAFAMGSFGAVGGEKTLPPGTTSAQRFAMASGTMPRPAINPMASFNRPGGAFPGGNAMTRTPSSSTMPNSPRQGSRQGGGRGSKAGYQGSSNKHQEAQAAKTMPLTAGMDLKPIQVSATGWKPRSIGASQSATGAAGPAPGASGAPGHMDPDMVQRKVKAALNKMTPEKFDKIADQILTIAAQSKDEADGRTLRQVIQLTFEKATDEAHWASMYAKFCKRMLETMSSDIKDESILDKNGNVVSGGNLFRKYLLNRCQEEFERGWKMDLPDKPEGERGEEKTEEAVMLSDEYYIAAAAKRRGLGLVQFIGELYKLTMLTERIMHECVKKLVDYTGIPDEAEIESLTKLLKTIGLNLDSTEKGKPMMDVYFSRIQSMVDTPDLPSRLRFMLMDIIDLRKKNWASKEDNKGPKTLEEVRTEAEAAAAQKAADNARGSQRGGGGGGRMQMGRGDSRNFSNQYGNQPPVDYQKNTVGMDDLRRLTNKNANRASSQQMSFGPTSMFSSRSNSGRKMGPGGALNRTGDDSGPSSRTGTPPQQKEKDATSANAFSLLAGLGSGEPENPASPPSTSVSPALSKASPATADKSDDKKENGS